MRIVIAHTSFDGFGGTETYMATIAQELQSLGHDVTIYGAERLGPVAQSAREAGLAVTGRLAELPAECDATIANDASSAVEMAARYPAAARLLVAHSDFFPLQWPPQEAGVCGAIVVLNDRVKRHVESLAFQAPVARLKQPVDMRRFASRGPAPAEARRALVLGNYTSFEQGERLRAACAEAGIEATMVGSGTEQTSTPERAIADHDLVIGLGRCIVEAMAGRRAAYVFGIAGGDGWVTTENYYRLEADGFGGGATAAVISFDQLTADLTKWHASMGDANRQLAMAGHDAVEHARSLIELLDSLEAGGGLPNDHAAEIARLIRAEWRTWQLFMGAMAENRELRREHRKMMQQRDEAHDQMARFVRTRRYRIASLIAAPLDRLRRRR